MKSKQFLAGAALLSSLFLSGCAAYQAIHPHEKHLTTLPAGGVNSFQRTTPFWLRQELQYYSGYNLAQYGALRRKFPQLQEVQEYVEKNFQMEAMMYEKSYAELDRIERLMADRDLSLYRYDSSIDGKKEFGLILLDKYGNVVEKVEGWMP